jgi:hypothetical protein
MQAPSEATWDRGRAALVTEVGRVAALLRSLERPVQPAVGSWNAAEVAVHLSQAFVAVPGLARGDLSEVFELLPGARRPSGALLGDLWDLAGTTVAAVRSEEERRPEVLADRLEQRCAAFLGDMDGRAPDEPRGWMVEGVTVPLATLTFHLLSETVVHGWDIARADGRPWAIDPSSAATATDPFFPAGPSSTRRRGPACGPVSTCACVGASATTSCSTTATWPSRRRPTGRSTATCRPTRPRSSW